MKNSQYFALFIIALAVSFNLQLIFPHQNNATLTLYAGQDDEEDKDEECILSDGTVGNETICIPGHSDCTPVLCSKDEM
jgi:hypothetical protein